jgi:Leucine-rich repeat (LRR) protein
MLRLTCHISYKDPSRKHAPRPVYRDPRLADSCNSESNELDIELLNNDSHIDAIVAETAGVSLTVGVQGPKAGRLSWVSPRWWEMSNIISFCVLNSRLEEIPRSVANMRQLRMLIVNDAWLERLPGELGRMPKLQVLDLSNNRLSWIPSTLVGKFITLDLSFNALVGRREAPYVPPLGLPGLPEPRDEKNGRNRSATVIVAECIDQLRVFRYEFEEAAIGLQDLDLPALVTLEILDALCPNAVPMHKKWDLIVAVKHYRR